MKKLPKDTAANPHRLAKVEAAFEQFKAENMERKTAVQEGRLPEKQPADWLYRQPGEINELNTM